MVVARRGTLAEQTVETVVTCADGVPLYLGELTKVIAGIRGRVVDIPTGI